MVYPLEMCGLEFQYEQCSGGFYLAGGQATRALIARGYSGKGSSLNHPECEAIHRAGPIPRGLWRIQSPVTHTRLGPSVFHLGWADALSQTPYGRSGFAIHGDNAAGDYSASEGCIVLPLAARTWLRTLVLHGMNRLRVV